jgi:hypothetical protein
MSQGNPGLGACKRVGRYYKPAHDTSAVFCLTDPKPEKWTQSTRFTDAWNELMGHVGHVLLQVDLTGIESAAKVVDWAYREEQLLGLALGTRKKSDHITAEKKYLNSAVDLTKYAKDKRLQARFCLPEVIVTQHIPLDRISFAKDQTRLVDFVNSWRGEWREGIEYQICQIPDLSVAYNASL